MSSPVVPLWELDASVDALGPAEVAPSVAELVGLRLDSSDDSLDPFALSLAPLLQASAPVSASAREVR
jgi:hypothetical protein